MGNDNIASESPAHSVTLTDFYMAETECTQALWKALYKSPKIIYKEMPEELRPNYQYFTEAKLDRLRDAGYDKPMTSLEDGVAEYVNNYLSKEDIYR